jgi:asparagine synthase (glutamine-hydrolysing)
MTGIAAIFSTVPASKAQLSRMLGAMEARGRDGIDSWTNGSFALGAAMLHTTAESLEAPQPHTNADASLAIVMDGYLTNWEELRLDLTERGAVLRNRSDAELALRAYEQWGEDCAARMEGEFAFIIADQRARRIYAARDHQGLRPLYYYQDKAALLVASDIAAIVSAAQKSPQPNLDYLANIASGIWCLRDDTVWQGVSRVPQSHWMTFSAAVGAEARHRQYYTLPVEVTLRYRDEREYAEHYRTMLFDAVRRTSRSHSPLAITVSGGLDSSAIFCIAHQLEQQGRLPAPGLQGYSLAGDEATRAYELPFARAAARHCGRSLIEVPLFRPGIEWFIDQGRRDCDIPIPQNGAMSLDLEQTAFANGSRAVLHGDGGDQWLDGSALYYNEFFRTGDVGGFVKALRRDAKAGSWQRALPQAARIGLGALTPAALRRFAVRKRLHRHFADPDHLYWMLPAWRERLLELQWSYISSLPEDPNARSKWGRLFSPYRALALDFMQRQRGQNGLETREPMQTRQFIEFSTTTPEWIRNQGGVTKVVHRKAMRGIMPDAIVERSSKAEFSAPAMSQQFAEYVRQHRDAGLGALCDADGLSRLVTPPFRLSIDPYYAWEVWGLCAVAALLANSPKSGPPFFKYGYGACDD